MRFKEHLADSIAMRVYQSAPNPSSVDVLRFSLMSLFDTLIILTFVLSICAVTGKFWPGVLAAFSFKILRHVSGGFHVQSANVCNVITTLFIVGAAHFTASFWNSGAYLTAVSIFLMVIYAPAGIEGLGRVEKKYHPVLKLIAVVIVASNFIWQSPVLAMMFFLQSLTLPKTAQRIADYIKF